MSEPDILYPAIFAFSVPSKSKQANNEATL